MDPVGRPFDQGLEDGWRARTEGDSYLREHGMHNMGNQVSLPCKKE